MSVNPTDPLSRVDYDDFDAQVFSSPTDFPPTHHPLFSASATTFDLGRDTTDGGSDSGIVTGPVSTASHDLCCCACDLHVTISHVLLCPWQLVVQSSQKPVAIFDIGSPQSEHKSRWCKHVYSIMCQDLVD